MGITRDLLEMQILGSFPRHTESETLGAGPIDLCEQVLQGRMLKFDLTQGPETITKPLYTSAILTGKLKIMKPNLKALQGFMRRWIPSTLLRGARDELSHHILLRDS